MNQSLRLIPLGGIGNVTKNMYLYEYDQQILIVDCGIGFPDNAMLGVDLLIPDVSYLKDKQAAIVGMIITHGHDDHIAGLPYILPQIGSNFPIFGSPLTLGFAQDRLKDFAISANFQKLPDQPFTLGPFTLDTVRVTHSIPDARHVVITTPVGTVYHGTDFKFDLNPVDGILPDLQKIALIGSRGVVALLSDCLNSEIDTFSQSESSIRDMFEREMRDIPGKAIITVMSSNLHRVQQAIWAAEAYQRRVCLIGRSIEQNAKTAIALNYLKPPKSGFINKKDLHKHQDKQLCLIIAGSQGQEGSSLTRAAEGEHRLVKITSQDKIIFSSEPIPGNESNVYAIIDTLSKSGADVTYADIDSSVHVSGHSSSIEQKLLIALTQPKRVVPIGGTYHHMIEYRRLARELGHSDDTIHLLENGQILSFNQDKAWVDETLTLKNVMVDGLGVGDVGNIVLRDRQRMADEGIVVILVPIAEQASQISGEIEIISRGFVYVKENQEVIDAIKKEAHSVLTTKRVVTNWGALRKKIEIAVEKRIYALTERRPLVLTFVLEV